MTEVTREGVTVRTATPKHTSPVAVLLGLAVLLPQYAFQGWALSILWGWFVVPPTGWHSIDFAAGAGLVVLATVFWRTKASIGTDALPNGGLGTPLDVLKAQVFRIALTFMTLGMGWVFQAIGG